MNGREDRRLECQSQKCVLPSEDKLNQEKREGSVQARAPPVQQAAGPPHIGRISGNRRVSENSNVLSDSGRRRKAGLPCGGGAGPRGRERESPPVPAPPGGPETETWLWPWPWPWPWPGPGRRRTLQPAGPEDSPGPHSPYGLPSCVQC